jgi:hypothetical protein
LYRILEVDLKGKKLITDISAKGKIILKWILEIVHENVDWVHLVVAKIQ